MADRVGQQFGNYRLVALLGRGGYAEVYLGQHVRLSLQAAIKVLHTHLSEHEAEHFQQEAETIATLMHPAVVRVFDFDVQEGVPFLVMDYAPNGSLRRRYPKGTVVPLAQIVSYVKQVAAALQYAHDHKFIHRDVKPENMLLGRNEELLLSDFGLAALAHSSASLSTQEAIGTLPYMAPEQIEGHPRAASDQYALGVVVYEWLCGSRPFEGSATEVMVRQLTMPPPPLHERISTIPLGVEQVVLRALAKDPKERFASVAAFAAALEQTSLHAPSSDVPPSHEQTPPDVSAAPSYTTLPSPPSQPTVLTEATPSADQAVLLPELAASVDASPSEIDTPQGQSRDLTPALGQLILPTAAATPSPAVVPPPLQTTLPIRQRISRLSGISAVMLIGLVVAGAVLGSTSLLARFGLLGTRSGPSSVIPVRGGTWTDGLLTDPNSFIAGKSGPPSDGEVDQALYLPLFYGDAQGVIHPGAATEVPSVQNGGISHDGKIWTFHLRPHLVWSDGAPYDARDVDFTWKLWRNPTFGFAGDPTGLTLITSADVSADHLTIIFHLKRAYAPFVSNLWVDGSGAPLPMHHFSNIAPGAILKSPDNLNPPVVSGPFLMAESVPGDHYTLVRNPRYYLASRGLPYLDKVVFRPIASPDTILKDLQAGTITSFWPGSGVDQVPQFQHLKNYTLLTAPSSASFEAIFFNFHNTILASHLEVRQAMAMAIDQQALIQQAWYRVATPLCTDHGSAMHPGYDPNASFGCPVVFEPAVANQLLNDNSWVRGADGVRTKGGQRLEFEYSTTLYQPARHDVEAILQRNFMAIGIKLDIQNYPGGTLFGPFLSGGKASPPTGAVAGRYDIAEYEWDFGYDPDDSGLLSCDQTPPNGQNYTFYCNPALDALYQQELATVDAGVRQGIFEQIHQIYLAQFPFITLLSPSSFAIVRKGVHNYSLSPIVSAGETVNIWQWWCDNAKC